MLLNEKIYKLRTEMNLTQESMAKYLDVDQGYISKIESNERKISLDLLIKIAKLFVCPLSDLIDETKEVKAISMPFRKKKCSVQDLENFSNANRIIMNLNEMVDLMED